MARYDRYNKFRRDGQILHVPYIEIPTKGTDLYTYYKAGKTRLDILSYQYYGDANYDWLILQANPEIGSLEYKIENGTRLRIPYPLDVTIARYNADVDVYDKLYGLEEKE